MARISGDQNNLFPNDCLAYDAVDLLYKGTGRVLILNTLLIELVDNSLRNAVRADNKNLALVYLADTLDGTAAMWSTRSFTMLIARFTPKQKPAESAFFILIESSLPHFLDFAHNHIGRVLKFASAAVYGQSELFWGQRLAELDHAL